ncbi:MAG: hypothetical protein Kow00105_13300 [Phycisphaeraceae bacterium]
MSVLGTGIAAAVAQTALQSQQVARQRDKREANRTRQAQRDLEVFQTRLLGLEEHDADEDATRLHVDNQQSDREHPDDRPRAKQANQHDPESPDQPTDEADAALLLQQLDASADPEIRQQAVRKPSQPDDALYTHIDIKA